MAGLTRWHLQWPSEEACAACREEGDPGAATLEHLVQVYGFNDAEKATVLGTELPIIKKKPALDAMAEIDMLRSREPDKGSATSNMMEKAMELHQDEKVTEGDHTLVS